ncbi:MAG: hypothetical protein ACFFA1_07450 [Promethearchaeota archaeon]
MSRINDEPTNEESEAELSAAKEEASAKQIIEDYLKQVKRRLSPQVAEDVIPELRSHLLEQGSHPTGELTSASAWDAVVKMGSPDMLAHEFQTESDKGITKKAPLGFMASLTTENRTLFWRIVPLIVFADLVAIALLTTFTLTGSIAILDYIGAMVGVQIWILMGIGITYFVLLYFSYPSGTSLEVIIHDMMDNFRNFFERKEPKEPRIARTQRKVTRRAKKFEAFTSQTRLGGYAILNGVGGVALLIIAFVLVSLVPTYPAPDLEFLQLLAIILFSRAALTGIRAAIGSESLGLARVLTSINALYAIVGIYFVVQLFYGPLSFPIIYGSFANGDFTLFQWKPYVLSFTWIVPIVIAIILAVMVYEIVEVNTYLRKTTIPEQQKVGQEQTSTTL